MFPIIFKVCEDSKDFLFQHAEQDGARNWNWNWNWKNRISNNQKEKGQQQNYQLLPNISLYTQKHKPKWIIWDILKIYPLRVASKFWHNSIKGLALKQRLMYTSMASEMEAGKKVMYWVVSGLPFKVTECRVFWILLSSSRKRDKSAESTHLFADTFCNGRVDYHGSKFKPG